MASKMRSRHSATQSDMRIERKMSRRFCCRAVVEVLLAAGVDVNTRTSAGTAMHEAALCGKMEVVRALLDRGVDLGIRDSRQNTVLDLLGQFPTNVTQDITAVIKSTVPRMFACNLFPAAATAAVAGRRLANLRVRVRKERIT